MKLATPLRNRGQAVCHLLSLPSTGGYSSAIAPYDGGSNSPVVL